jgi:hypothetical protein
MLFKHWIQEKSKTTVSQSWAGIILFGEGCERRAFYRFYKEFEEFLNQNESLKSENFELGENPQFNSDDVSHRIYDIYEFIEKIKKRPGMYLGTNSITNLDMVLRGYSLARRDIGLAPTEQERDFVGFQSWIQEKYGFKSNQSWAKIILFESMDEQEALKKFFELFEEYSKQNKSLEVDENARHLCVNENK